MDLNALEEMIHGSDAMSSKIIALSAKYNALDECMAAVKKGFEKGVIELDDFLKTIRMLSGKQCKQIFKMQKIRGMMQPQQQMQPQNMGYAQLS